VAELQRTPLFGDIQSLNPRCVPFAGWEMPVQFSSLKAEHEAVRTGVGAFDISHMGKFVLTGQDVVGAMEPLVPSCLGKLRPGQAQYSVLLNEAGGIIDDIIFYYCQPDRAYVIVNASRKDQDLAWIQAHLDHNLATIEDLSAAHVLVAIQGPAAESTLQPFVAGKLNTMEAFDHQETTVDGDFAFVARTGYTGEDGFEVMVPIATGKKLWSDLMAAGVVPCGLGARDTLRLEAAMHLYGQDLDETTTPLEAGLNWLVHLQDKGDFMGRAVLEAQKSQGVSRKLVALEMQSRYIARHGYQVWDQDNLVGTIASGTMSPTLGKAIALAYVPTPLSKRGQTLQIQIRKTLEPAIVVKKPFYRSAHPAKLTPKTNPN
jgi:aminomethyltransferase